MKLHIEGIENAREQAHAIRLKLDKNKLTKQEEANHLLLLEYIDRYVQLQNKLITAQKEILHPDTSYARRISLYVTIKLSKYVLNQFYL